MKLKELQDVFDEMTRQLKELDAAYPTDKESEHYKTLWNDRADIKNRIEFLKKTNNPCECECSMCPMMSDINSTPEETYHWWVCNKCNAETEHTKDNKIRNPKLCEYWSGTEQCNDLKVKDTIFCRFHIDNLPF